MFFSPSPQAFFLSLSQSCSPSSFLFFSLSYYLSSSPLSHAFFLSSYSSPPGFLCIPSFPSYPLSLTVYFQSCYTSHSPPLPLHCFSLVIVFPSPYLPLPSLCLSTSFFPTLPPCLLSISTPLFPPLSSRRLLSVSLCFILSFSSIPPDFSPSRQLSPFPLLACPDSPCYCPPLASLCFVLQLFCLSPSLLCLSLCPSANLLVTLPTVSFPLSCSHSACHRPSCLPLCPAATLLVTLPPVFPSVLHPLCLSPSLLSSPLSCNHSECHPPYCVFPFYLAASLSLFPMQYQSK